MNIRYELQKNYIDVISNGNHYKFGGVNTHNLTSGLESSCWLQRDDQTEKELCNKYEVIKLYVVMTPMKSLE